MRPLVVIPMGDAAGIGPEITVKTLASEHAQQYARMVVVGNKHILEQALKFSGVSLAINVITGVNEYLDRPGLMNLIECGDLNIDVFQPGEIQGQCGRAAYDCIEKAVKMTLRGDVDAVATTPINKESLRAGGVDFIGHTEIFASSHGYPRSADFVFRCARCGFSS